MGYLVGFILEYSPIPQITRKSKLPLYSTGLSTLILNIISRVLLATIRNLGSFPCPRCLIPKEKIPEVGTKNDDQRRETQRRVADNSLISKINTARTWIYNEGYRIKAAAVERLLSPTSLVPTIVRPELLSPFPNLLCWVLECLYSSISIWI